MSISALVQLADKIAHTMNLGDDSVGPVLVPADWSSLGLGEQDLDKLMASVTLGVQDMCRSVVTPD